MTGEVTVPLLPCASIDEVVTFYEALGFTRTYLQTRPYPCAGLRREDFQLQFFGIDGFVPADSYGSCVVVVPDVGDLHAAFAAGLRDRYGKVPVAGIPRMTRPRKRKNADGLTGFTVVDPGGNWIRIYPATRGEPATSGEQSRLAAALDNAVVLGDSKGDHAQAAKILDGALARNPDATTEDRVAALTYRLELAENLSDETTAAAMRAELRAAGVEAGGLGAEE